jgi:carbonic anhydrase/acetyltransferase-like protein (isoleucine patch superfamily)
MPVLNFSFILFILSILFETKFMIKAFRGVEPKIHGTAFVAEDAVIIGNVEIGEQSSVWYGSVLRGDVNFIRIGNRTNIQDGSVIHVTTAIFPTILGDEITVGHRVTLHGCQIGSNCLIGIGAILLDGVHVGENSLVAAGSLVTPNTLIPPRSMVMGSPAKVKRELSDEEITNLKHFWHTYTELTKIYLQTDS